MKVLHLFSNYRFTGPAEPVMDLCRSLAEHGVDVLLASSRPPEWAKDSLHERATGRGIRAVSHLELKKHFRLLKNLRDARVLRRLVREESIQLVHTHMSNDHMIVRMARPRVPILRTCYGGFGLRQTLRNRLMLARATDGLIVFSQRARAHLIDVFRFPAERIWVISAAIDTDRFRPGRRSHRLRQQWGVRENDFLVGVVARIQKHRRFKVLLKAVQKARQRLPNLKLIVVGRGTRQKEVLLAPARRRKLQGAVRLVGYYRGDDYVEALRAFDTQVFLMPGTDGTCRAVREALAIGTPVIAADRGMLPEIVEDGRTGRVIRDTPSNLADALVQMGSDPALRRRLRRQAAERAARMFHLDRQAGQVRRVYRDLLERGKRK